MSKAKKVKAEAKKQAYANKKEAQSRSIINWIFAGLVAFGVVIAIASAVMYS